LPCPEGCKYTTIAKILSNVNDTHMSITIVGKEREREKTRRWAAIEKKFPQGILMREELNV